MNKKTEIDAIIERCTHICYDMADSWRESVTEGDETLAYEVLILAAASIKELKEKYLQQENKMNELEATRIKLKCLEMVEGTRVEWWGCLRYNLNTFTYEPLLLSRDVSDYQISLGLLEGKPVFEGDQVYCNGDIVYATETCDFSHSSWSWNPPKPKPEPIPAPQTKADIATMLAEVVDRVEKILKIREQESRQFYERRNSDFIG